MAVNLDDLRIDRETQSGRKKTTLAWVVIAGLILAGAVTGYLLWKPDQNGDKGLPVRVVPVVRRTEEGPAPRSFTAGGWVEPAFPWPVVISAQVRERVEKLLAQEGDRVSEGQVVARLYDGDLRDEVSRAKAELAVATAVLSKSIAGERAEDIAEARAILKQLEAERDLLKRVADRSASLIEEGVVSVEQAERDRAAYRAAAARMDAQKARLDRLVAGPRKEEIAQARAEVDRRKALLALAEKKLGYVDVKAPATGRVLRLLVEQGQRITEEKPFVASLYDPDALWVRVDVAQVDIGKVNIGQSAEVLTDAEPGKRFPATVIRIDPAADFAKNTITVRVALSRSSEKLHPDMTARVHFHAPSAPATAKTAEEKGRLMVPRVAVVRKDGHSAVYEFSGGTARRRDIKVGGTLGDEIEVLEGLTVGMRVIVDQVDQIEDGMAVRLARNVTSP